MVETTHVVRQIREAAIPLAGGRASDLDPLLQRIGDARIVLLGDASHGTHEFYDARAAITKRLIALKGFRAVAIEADWPDTSCVDRWVRAGSADVGEAEDALDAFGRFPGWMWRTVEVSRFLRWLRLHNDIAGTAARQVGVYGLDLFSFQGAIGASPPGPARAGDGSDLGRLHVEQAARLVRNAARYRRSLAGARASSWNLRDRHMAETVEALAAHLESAGQEARIVVWAHNSHVGDSRATEMSRTGEVNLGHLLRERWGPDVVAVGLTTHHGVVTAAREWYAAPEQRVLGPALAGSWEAIFHATGLSRFLLVLTGTERRIEGLEEERLERAVGVVYFPETERASHYFLARLGWQFDAVIHLDETSGTEPLESEGRSGMAAGQ
ncbi:MAG: erythromycin esterase family protein [Deltaproteobacteria bacterium]|nr:erythromycin esterase family protein [Deltaproteobacteria bacterium]